MQLAIAAITITQKALDDKTNTFATGGQLTTTDVQNTASYSGSGFSVSASISTGKDKAGTQVSTPGGSMGIGSDKGSAASTTVAGITGIAGNTSTRTSDAETGLQKIFDADTVNKKVNASIAITGSFGKQASKAIGDYAAGQMDEAGRLRVKAQGLKADDPERSKLTVEADTIEAKWV